MSAEYHPADSLLGRTWRVLKVMGLKAAAAAIEKNENTLYGEMDVNPRKPGKLGAVTFFQILHALKGHSEAMGHDDYQWADPLRGECHRLGFLLVPITAAAAGAEGVLQHLARAHASGGDVAQAYLEMHDSDSPGGPAETPEEKRHFMETVLKCNTDYSAAALAVEGSTE